MNSIAKRVAERFASRRLELGPARVDATASARLLKLKKFPVRHRGDLNGAVISAAGSAKKLGQTVFLYQGNSNMWAVWRTSLKPSEYLDPINNTGSVVLSVSPELEVHVHDVKRPA